MKQLSDKQLRFIELYAGNATEAAQKAGYSHAENAGMRCMKNAQIQNCYPCYRQPAAILLNVQALGFPCNAFALFGFSLQHAEHKKCMIL